MCWSFGVVVLLDEVLKKLVYDFFIDSGLLGNERRDDKRHHERRRSVVIQYNNSWIASPASHNDGIAHDAITGAKRAVIPGLTLAECRIVESDPESSSG